MGTFTHAQALRELADAIDRQRAANTLSGISAPRQIAFYYELPGDMDGYGNNPTLQEAIMREIRISWDELRQQALTRLDDSVAQLSERVRGHLAPTQGEGER